MSTHSELPVIHSFWHGPPLTRIEKLSLRSFVSHNHPVHLHCYEIPEGVPPGVTIVDARSIIPADKIFYYGGRKSYSGRGSIAAFANWFRYELLYSKGGIWVDTDMVCLKPFRFASESVFAWEDRLRINIAVLGLRPGDPLARWMADLCMAPNRILPYDNLMRVREKLKRRFLEGNKRGNVQWGELGPRGFTLAADNFGRTREAMPESTFYPIHFENWRDAYDPVTNLVREKVSEAHGIHLWNEMTRGTEFDKNAIHQGSLFEELWLRYFS